MPSSGKINLDYQLVEQVYAAASGDISWDQYLAEMARFFHCEQAMMLTADKSPLPDSFVSSSGLNLDIIGKWNEEKTHIDPWYLGAARASNKMSYFGEELISSTALRQGTFYNDILRPMNIESTLGCIVPQGDVRRWVFAVYRSKAAARFSDDERRVMDDLSAHQARAIELHLLFNLEQHLGQVQKSLLESIPCAAVLLDCYGRVIEANEVAVGLTLSRNGICVLDQRLCSSTSFGNEIMLRALHECIEPNNLIKRHVQLERIEPSSPLDITFVAINSGERNVIGENRAVSLGLIIDYDEPVTLSADELVLRFGLSNAEAKLALMLVRLTKLSDAAYELGISRNTAKTQLRNVYSKLGVDSRTRMVRRLFTGGHFTIGS